MKCSDCGNNSIKIVACYANGKHDAIEDGDAEVNGCPAFCPRNGQWISVDYLMPKVNTKVAIIYEDVNGIKHLCFATWVASKTIELNYKSNFFVEDCEWSEDESICYVPEGWYYEEESPQLEYMSVIEGKVLYWTKLEII